MDVQKIEHSESLISINDLKSSSEAFIASANRDLIPVVSVNGNQIGDGKIFVSTIDTVLRIRTGETGSDAL